ncbi:MAG: class I SAM-dependent methyltransferase [Simkaniaceae bacterium]|nr:class I SAM-dependent methyltransferase [Candidatus Sacchlamyda saccharinae]
MKTLLLLLLLPISLIGMTLDRVILSTDDNPTYIDFWPVVADTWERVTGLRPTLALVASEDVHIDESLGDVIRFEPIEGIPTSMQAQVIRLLLPTLFPDDVCLISDIDMIPLQKAYFFDTVALSKEEDFVVFRSKAYERWGYPQYPMCYVAAKGETFQALFDISSEEDFPRKMIEWAQLGHGWSTDERVLYQAVQDKKDQLSICLKEQVVERRLDRLDWRYKDEWIHTQNFIDAHLLRPYKEFQVETDQLIFTLFHPDEKRGLPLPRNEWHFLDKEGNILPWFTRPFLDVMLRWDLSDWDVLEYGSGYSTLWLAEHCKSVVAIEDNRAWAHSVEQCIREKNLLNCQIQLHEDLTSYVSAVDENEKLYDCVIVDGVERNECLSVALKHLKPGGILILDNANQATCGFDSTPSFALLTGFEHHSYQQPNHPDWRTDYWVIDDKNRYKPEKKEPLPFQKNRVVDWEYGTHLTPLLTALAHTDGPVLEMGCGDFSTPPLHSICQPTRRFLVTAETDERWMGLFTDLACSWHHFQYVPCYDELWTGQQDSALWNSVGSSMPRWGVVFIDHRPGERRVIDIQRMRHKADIIVVHDTQQPAYGYEPTLSTFKYRYTYRRYAVETTLVSETIDVAKLFED